MVQRFREKEQKKQPIYGTESILLKGYITEIVRNYNEKSSGRLDSSAAWYPLRSRRFLACRLSFWLLQIFEILKRKQFSAAPISSLSEDFWYHFESNF